MSGVSGKAFDSSLLRRIYSFTIPYRRQFWQAVILTILLAFLAPARPVLTQYILDNAVIKGDYQQLKLLVLIMVVLLLAQSVVQYFHALLTNLLGQKVIRDMRKKLFGRMVQFRLSYFDKTPVGTTVTRSVSDMETIADIFSEGLIVIIGDLLQLAVIIVVMFIVDWRLALISLSTIPLLMIATNIFKNKIKAVFGDVRTQVSHLNTFVQEHLTGMRIIQMFNRQQEEYHRFEKINKEHRDANVRSVWYYSIFFPVVEILSAVSIGLIVWWGAGEVIKEEVTFGNLVAFIMYINMLFRPIRELADKFNTLQMGMVSSERIFKVMDEDQVAVDTGTITDHAISGAIEFRDVWFAYDFDNGNNPDPEYVLKGISFTVSPGESIAFVGATGAGKSTIISLLNRLYEVSRGAIYIDGKDINEYKLETLRRAVAVVLQDVFLFSDSILNNICLSDHTIPLQRVIEASKAVGAYDFISRLPDNFNFQVHERGSMLSMGQRQLLSFIRAFIHQPAILVLDEATSSVDSETEELITTATQAVTVGRTSIIIAHRLSTIQNADRIIVMDHGQIIETGKHSALLENKGHYSKLFEIQFKNL
ncbi:MAG: ABC transporter ATP-binding protein [Bacteroidota bacterium]